MDGKFLDSDAVRRLEKMPNKLQLLTSVAVMIKKARSPSAAWHSVAHECRCDCDSHASANWRMCLHDTHVLLYQLVRIVTDGKAGATRIQILEALYRVSAIE